MKLWLWNGKSGSVVGKQKKTFGDITKTQSGNRWIPLNDIAVALLIQIQDYNKKKGIKRIMLQVLLMEEDSRKADKYQKILIK